MNITDSAGLKAGKPGLIGKSSGAAAVVPCKTVAGAGAQNTAPVTQLMSTHADFDAAKVAEIRASISAGCYVVNTGRIADGLLASARELVKDARS